MVSQNRVCVGFLLLVLCITYGSARKIISEDVMLNESKRRLSGESMPIASEPLASTDVMIPEPVQENSIKVLEVAPSGEPMGLGDTEVGPIRCGMPMPACGRTLPGQIIPGSPCGCGFPNYVPPNPCQQPYSPLPPFYQPPQQAPTYQPPQTEPGCQQGLPPQQSPMYQPIQPEPGCQQALPPQQSPTYQPPQPAPGCQQALPPQQYYPPAAPAYPPQVSPCQQPTSPNIPPQTGTAYQPQPAPFYPPQTEPTYPPPLVDPNCILGCPPTNTETSNVGELDHEKKDGESMNEEEMFSSPPPLGG